VNVNSFVGINSSAPGLLQRSLETTGGDDDIAAVVSTLTRDELITALVELLDLVDHFVLCLAERNAISERAVLRSMGIEPDPRFLRANRAGGPRRS
jgi:hypothetical protein